VPDKAQRVHAFHKNTMHSLAELIGAAGLAHPKEVTADYLMCRDASGKATPLFSRLPTLKAGALLRGASQQSDLPEDFSLYWDRAKTSAFGLAS
jgi:hypothetical protein